MNTQYTTILGNSQYKMMANAIRALTMDAIQKANSGHPGMPMGMADIATILYSEFLKFNPSDPKWPNRDRLVLSAGHGSMLLYSLFYLLGYKDISLDDIKNFRQLESKTAGHPEYGMLAGIETTTGPLGQGIANAVGMAIAEKKFKAKFGQDVIDHKIYAICGDGCLMEGISQEAISLAGNLNLSNLIVIFDDNNISIDGNTSLAISDNHLKRFEASNWNTIKINGHDHDQIRAALFKAGRSDKPTLIACETKIAYGSPNKAGSEKSHGAPLGEDEIIATKKNLNWAYGAFDIPEDILTLWRTRAKRCEKEYEQWTQRDNSALFEFISSKHAEIEADFITLKETFTNNISPEATRKSSGNVIDFLMTKFDNLIGGSADLSESNNTKSHLATVVSKGNFSGNYLHYGVREHAMVAIMNGMSLYGGLVPFAGTFLVFSDYAKPAIRLASLMKRKIILIMTHDSIGLGEDGPTHQPIEQLAALRSIPDICVLRPADKIECLEAWQIALEFKGPTIIALSRQALPLIRTNFNKDNLSQKGAYVIKESSETVDVTIFATGSELHIALNAYAKLTAANIKTRVVSVPSWELFNLNDKEYKDSILKNDSIKIAIEAASPFGWEKFIGQEGIFIGMDKFGASAPADQLYEHFKITDDQVVLKVMERIRDRSKTWH